MEKRVGRGGVPERSKKGGKGRKREEREKGKKAIRSHERETTGGRNMQGTETEG